MVWVVPILLRLFVFLVMFVKLVTEIVPLVFALEQKIWSVPSEVCKVLVTILLNLTQEVP